MTDPVPAESPTVNGNGNVERAQDESAIVEEPEMAVNGEFPAENNDPDEQKLPTTNGVEQTDEVVENGHSEAPSTGHPTPRRSGRGKGKGKGKGQGKGKGKAVDEDNKSGSEGEKIKVIIRPPAAPPANDSDVDAEGEVDDEVDADGDVVTM